MILGVCNTPLQWFDVFVAVFVFFFVPTPSQIARITRLFPVFCAFAPQITRRKMPKRQGSLQVASFVSREFLPTHRAIHEDLLGLQVQEVLAKSFGEL